MERLRMIIQRSWKKGVNIKQRVITVVLLVCCSLCGLVFGRAGGGEAAKPVGPKLWLDSKAIDLGKIAVDQQEIEGVIP